MSDVSNQAMPDGVHAPDILDFSQTDEMVSDLPEDELRDRVVEILEAMVDLGLDDVPPGRRAAYGDVIAGTDPKYRQTLLAKDRRASSCALVVRAVWRFLGAEDAKLLDQFVVSKPFQYVCDFARKCGAYTAVRPGDHLCPRRGDVLVVYRGTSQHIFTLIDVDGDTFTSIDGGEPSMLNGVDDGTCNGIHRMMRELDRRSLVFHGDLNRRPIIGWIDVSKLRFTRPRIELDRKWIRA